MERINERIPQRVTFTGGELVENTQAGRIQFCFDDIPSPEIRKMLKRHGFKWAPSENAWQRHFNTNGIYAAKQVLQNILKAALVQQG